MPCASNTRGFTLLEILVSLSIISILIGLSLPALRMAQESGRNAVCSANLHTYGQMIAMYREEHEGSLPFSRHVFSNVRIGWTELLDELLPYMDGVQLPYVGPDGVMATSMPFRCPSDPYMADMSGMSYGYGPGDFMNSVTSSKEEVQRLAKLVTTNMHEQSPVLADGDRWHAHMRRNVLRLDGSIGSF